MLARLLAHCVEQIALDGEQGTSAGLTCLGSDVERVFAFAAACCAREGVHAVLDAPYRAYVWEALLAHPAVYVGVCDAPAPAAASSAPRTSVLGKARPASAAPRAVAPGPLAALQATHGVALRVAVDASRVRRLLTGTDDAAYVSQAAYHILQHVSRARAAGLTVVDLGAATGYDQKTLYYLVKALLERDLVAKFAAPEMGHVSNYIVGKAFLADNPQWRAQQDALGDAAPGDVGEPNWVCADRLAMGDCSESSDEEVPGAAIDGVAAPDAEMLAFPMLSEEQSKVWLHSRQDLLSARLHKLLARSPAHTTPRRLLATRLGLRPVSGAKRALIAFLNRHIAAGDVERVRVQLNGATPLYLRATDTEAAQEAHPTPPARPSKTRWALVREARIEAQLLAYIHAAHDRGRTLNELAMHFHASTDVKRMMEQILARQSAPPYTPHTICAPFEQEGRERRIRYYTFPGFAARCASDHVELAAALGLAPGSAVPLAAAPLPPTLPGEAQFADAAAYASAADALQRREVGFFRDVAGPVPLRKRKGAPIDPMTGKAKRGRPRKAPPADASAHPRPAEAAAHPPPVLDPAPDAAPPPALAGKELKQEANEQGACDQAAAAPDASAKAAPRSWAQLQPTAPRADGRRANMSTFHRSTLLLTAVERAGGVLDELDVPRILQDTDGPDLSDRTTRTKVVREAVRRQLLRTTKVQRDAGDTHRQRTILYLPTLPVEQLHAFLQDAVQQRTRSTAPKPTDLSAEEAGLARAYSPTDLPWASDRPVDVDALDVRATRAAFATLSHVLRAYYGFSLGAAARLRLFHEAALRHDPTHLSLAYFWTACSLWTYVALVPVKLRTRSVVRAVLQGGQTTRVDALPEPVAQRLGLRRMRAHLVRFQSYAEQLVALGAATHEGEGYRLTSPTLEGTVYDVHTPHGFAAFWDAVRTAYTAARRAAPPPLAFLRAPHAWQDTYVLRRPQKRFLRRLAPHDAQLPHVAHACLAPEAAVRAFYATPRRPTRPAREVLAEKLAARRTQRAAEFDALLAAEAAEHTIAPERQGTVEKLLAQYRRRYVYGRDALVPATLQARLRSTLAARTPRGRGTQMHARRRTVPWTPEEQETLRDAYVVLRERHAHAGGVLSPAPLAQLAPPDAFATWRVRWKQLVHARTEHAPLRAIERAWAPVVAEARATGALPDPAFPALEDVDLRAHIAYLRAHVDKRAALAATAHTAPAVLPRRARPNEAARWAPLAPRVSLALPNAGVPMVHRLHAQRSHAASMGAFAPYGALPIQNVAEAAVRLLVHAEPGAVQTLAAALGAAAIDAAIAQLVARRVVRVIGERHGRAQLAFTDEHARALQEPVACATMREAQHATDTLATSAHATAHPAATEGETAAWIALLDQGAVAATLDLRPLAALRKRTQLNARTLDDVETECCVALDVQTPPRPYRVALPVPPLDVADDDGMSGPLAALHAPGAFGIACSAGDTSACAASVCSALQARLDADPAGVLVAHLAPQERHAACALGAAVACVGYDDARIVSTRHIHRWTLAVPSGRMVPSAWRTVQGTAQPAIWAQRVGLVQSWCVARPGISLAHLARLLAPALDRMELVCVLAALTHAGLVRIRTPDPSTPVPLLPDTHWTLDPGAAATWFAGA